MMARSENGLAAALNEEQERFWRAAQSGVLLLKRCMQTGKVFHYPRDASPFTLGPTQWIESSGNGEIYSCSLAYRADPPYCIAYVRLDEGPLILTNVVAGQLASVAIGQRVKVIFRAAGDGTLVPMFTPI